VKERCQKDQKGRISQREELQSRRGGSYQGVNHVCDGPRVARTHKRGVCEEDGDHDDDEHVSEPAREILNPLGIGIQLAGESGLRVSQEGHQEYKRRRTGGGRRHVRTKSPAADGKQPSIRNGIPQWQLGNILCHIP